MQQKLSSRDLNRSWHVALNFAMPWPPHTSFASHLGHSSKNVLDTPLCYKSCTKNVTEVVVF